jgi:DNA adenine methylase
MREQAPTRPVLRWYGGKWRLAPWIISNFPKHRAYVEPFGGAGSVLLRKPRAYVDIWNDLDDWAVNLFRVLRDDLASARLVELLRMTPFARSEFDLARQIDQASGDPVEMARLLVVRSYMGFGANAHNGRSTGFRSNSSRSNTTPAHDWANYPDCLMLIIDRLKGVIVENRCAREVMVQHDAATTLHYVDPPYLPDTRSPANRYDLKYRAYRHELTEDGHVKLLDLLCELKGMVVLSGYPSPMYDDALADWRRLEMNALADGARARTEVLWLNPACAAALDRERMPLFASLQPEEGLPAIGVQLNPDYAGGGLGDV